MTETEEYFPRGGKKPNLTHFKQSSNFLGAPDRGNKKRKNKKKSENSDGYFSDEGVKHVNLSMTNCAVGISYKTVKEGLLILGRVHKTTETKITVMLPCRMKGTVMACHVSHSYNKLLEAYVNDKVDRVRELSSMFRPGQYVALKVIEIEKEQIMLSMMPQHVNGGKTHADLQKGALLQAAVSSVEDHGYVMDIGIPNTRAFLPAANTNPEIELDAGLITWCCVKSTSPASDNTVVTLTNELSALQKSVVRKKTIAPLLPGTAFEFTVDEPLDNGIEGHIFEDSTSYIQRQHTDTVNGKKPKLGQKIRAHLLYVMPTRNTPFLQMKNIFETTYPDLAEEQKYREGDIINDAKVIKVTGRSIIFRLGESSTGRMSVLRVQPHEDFTDEQLLAKSYPTGSVHSVRVICYHLSDFIYVVTDETSLLREPYFTLRDISPGAIVRATVRELRDNFLLINIGRLIGYVPKTHFHDTGVFVDPKKPSSSKILQKFKVGQEVKARVLSVNEEKNELHCTLKPSLLDPELQILDSYDQKHVGKAYTGTIKFVHSQYVLVSFFNDVKGYVSRSHCSRDPDVVLHDIYHLGQIVKCTITKVDVENKKMIGSFNIPPFTPLSEQNGKSGKRKRKSDNTEITSKKKKVSKDLDAASNSEVAGDVQEKHKKKSKKLDRKKSDHVTEGSDGAAEDSDAIELDIPERKKKKKGKKLDEFKVATEDSDEMEADSKEEIKKKRKKKVKVGQDVKDCDESDPIDTDLPESDNDVLTPQDLGLMDLSDCITPKQYKKRVTSILKSINARRLRRKRIEHKIARIEGEGLNPKNKIFHTAMHAEKLVIQQRIEKLRETLSLAQEKLKEFKRESSPEYRKKRKEKRDGDTSEKPSVDVKKIKDSIKVVEDMKPVMEVPSAKDFWSTDIEISSKNTQEEELSSSSDEEAEEQPKKKRKKLTPAEKVNKAREEEERVRELERLAVESETRPHSSEQFERALLASPHSSQLWIAYMAFHLQATELDKARAVCRRALNTISFREEDEKLNVWVAAINIENRFGTKETQQKILEEALQMNEPYKVHLKLLDIYVETSQQQELAALVDLMMRKYKRQEEVYTQCGDACYRAGLLDKARHVMQRAIAVLDKKQHVGVLVQFALLERRLGAAERSDALLEQVLAVYPQRVDVCSVYVDMLLKAKDLNKIRQVMERMTSQKLPARKIKVLYKKWIEVEEKIGDHQQAESIRQRALEYINKAKF